MKKWVVITAMVLASAGTVMALESPQTKEAATLSPIVWIPGNIFEGDFLRIGINDAGSLGVGQGMLGVGLQFAGDTPYQFPTTESLAIFYWGEGYYVAYNEMNPMTMAPTIEHQAYYQPELGWPPPPSTNLSVLGSAKFVAEFPNQAIKEAVVVTNDGLMRLTFSFVFDKQQPGLILKTTLQNIGTKPLRDVIYKRIVDFDVLGNVFNQWSSSAFEATAWTSQPGGLGYLPPGLIGPARLTVAGQQGHQQPLKRSFLVPLMPNLIDLNAWDDSFLRSPRYIETSHNTPDEDCNAALYYALGYFAPGESKDVFTIFQTNFPRK